MTPNGTPNPRIFTKNARTEAPKSPKWSKKVVFWSIKSENKFWTEKKSKKKESERAGSLGRRVDGTMYNVGGRVREGWPPNFGLSFVQGPRDAGQGRRI